MIVNTLNANNLAMLDIPHLLLRPTHTVSVATATGKRVFVPRTVEVEYDLA